MEMNEICLCARIGRVVGGVAVVGVDELARVWLGFSGGGGSVGVARGVEFLTKLPRRGV